MEDKVKRRRTPGSAKELKLTPGETLLIWRKRKHWNQQQAAKHYKVSVFHYKMREYDKITHEGMVALNDWRILPHEKCVIYRKRSEKTQKEVATEVGVGRYWVRLMEKGLQPCTRLLTFWEGQ